MSEQKKSDFVVSDRRKFTIEGELKPEARGESAEESRTESSETPGAPDLPPPGDVGSQAAPPSSGAPHLPSSTDLGTPTHDDQPATPSAFEQHEQAEAYRSQTADIDARIQKELDQRNPGRKASDFE